MVRNDEWRIQATITKWLKKNHVIYNKLMSLTFAGWPDLLIVKNGNCYFFEVKKIGGKLSRLQEIAISNLNKTKEIAFVVRSLDEFLKIWEGLP